MQHNFKVTIKRRWSFFAMLLVKKPSSYWVVCVRSTLDENDIIHNCYYSFRSSIFAPRALGCLFVCLWVFVLAQGIHAPGIVCLLSPRFPADDSLEVGIAFRRSKGAVKLRLRRGSSILVCSLSEAAYISNSLGGVLSPV